MQAAQEDAQRVARELEGAEGTIATYEGERGSVRAILRLLVRAVVDRVRRRRRRGRVVGGLEGVGVGGEEGGEGEGGEYAGVAYEKARLYAQRTEARAQQGLQAGGQGQQQWAELDRLIAGPAEQEES
jgi:hypothetical protein